MAYKGFGKAIEFNSSLNRYAQTAGGASFSFTWSEFYFRSVVALNATTNAIYSLVDIGSNFKIYYNTNSLVANLRDFTTGVLTTLTAALSGNIRQGPFVITVMCKGAESVLAINGFHMDRKSGPSSVLFMQPMILGFGSGSSDSCWNGPVDDTVLHNEIPSDANFDENYYELFEPADTSKYAHVWNMEDQDSNIIHDKGTSTAKLDLTIHNNAPYVEGLCLAQQSVSRSNIVSSGIGEVGKYDYFFTILRNTHFVFSVNHPKKYGVGAAIWKLWPSASKEMVSSEEWYFKERIWIMDKVFPNTGTYFIEFHTKQEGVVSRIHLDVVDETIFAST